MRASLVFSVALAGLTGCDQLLKLNEVSVPRDAAGGGDSRDDAAVGPDGPPRRLCDGAHVPQFGSSDTNVFPGCSYYSEGAPRMGIGVCSGTIVGVDTVAGTTSTQNGITAGMSPSQSGDQELFTNDNGTIYSYFASTIANSWTTPTAQGIPLTLAAGDHVSAPSGTRGPGPRRLIAFHYTTQWTAVEFVQAGSDQWAGPTSLDAQVNVAIVGPGTLSHDGLRLVFPTAGGVSFSSRADLTSAFTAATSIFAGATSATTTPYLSEDCSRLYFTDAGGTLVYADRAP